MAKLTPGVFADTAFPNSVWVDNVWANYGVPAEIIWINSNVSFSGTKGSISYT